MRVRRIIVVAMTMSALVYADVKRAAVLRTEADLKVSALGEFEVKPSWNPSENRVYSVNHGELGARVGRGSLSYQQEFTNEIFDGEDSGKDPFQLSDGFVRFRFNEIWKSENGGSPILSFESRFYLPTDPKKAEKGMILALRNYLKLIFKRKSGFSLTLMEVPIHHFYSEAGDMTPSANYYTPPKYSVNPIFENRVFVVFDYSPSKSPVSLAVPLMWSATRSRDFHPEAEGNDGWSHAVLVMPELTFGVTDGVRLGIEYESGNLANLQGSDAESEKTVGSGTFRFILRASF